MKSRIVVMVWMMALVAGCGADNPVEVTPAEPAASSDSAEFASLTGTYVRVGNLNDLKHADGGTFLTVYEINKAGALSIKAESSLDAAARELGTLKVEQPGRLFSYMGTNGVKVELAVVPHAAFPNITLGGIELVKVDPQFGQKAVQAVNDGQAALKQNLMGTKWKLSAIQAVERPPYEPISYGTVTAEGITKKGNQIALALDGTFTIPEVLSFTDRYRAANAVALTRNALNLDNPLFEMGTGLKFKVSDERFGSVDWLWIHTRTFANHPPRGSYPSGLANHKIGFTVKAVEMGGNKPNLLTLEFQGTADEANLVRQWIGQERGRERGAIHFIYQRVQ